MGVYYQVACDELQERIDPGSVDNFSIKAWAIAHRDNPFGQFVIFALRTRWIGKSVRLVHDSGDDPGYFDYKEVTEDIVHSYNDEYKTFYQFTGDEEV